MCPCDEDPANDRLVVKNSLKAADPSRSHIYVDLLGGLTMPFGLV